MENLGKSECGLILDDFKEFLLIRCDDGITIMIKSIRIITSRFHGRETCRQMHRLGDNLPSPAEPTRHPLLCWFPQDPRPSTRRPKGASPSGTAPKWNHTICTQMMSPLPLLIIMFVELVHMVVWTCVFEVLADYLVVKLHGVRDML